MGQRKAEFRVWLPLNWSPLRGLCTDSPSSDFLKSRIEGRFGYLVPSSDRFRSRIEGEKEVRSDRILRITYGSAIFHLYAIQLLQK